MRALITNDDGIGSEGLVRLATLAVELGHEVVVAAPAQEASGSSAAITAVRSGDHIRSKRVELPGLPGVPAYGVEATPAMIVLVALASGFGEPPDLVLSGINRGANTGTAVMHSGTVGAALTAVSRGCRGMAVSLASASPQHWEAAVQAAREAFSLLDDDGRAVVNVNAPDVPPDRVLGLKPASLASFGVVQTAVAAVGEGTLQLALSDSQAEHEEGTDAAFLAAGWATVTSLQPMCEVSVAGRG